MASLVTIWLIAYFYIMSTIMVSKYIYNYNLEGYFAYWLSSLEMESATRVQFLDETFFVFHFTMMP